jgi:hypothetical protein
VRFLPWSSITPILSDSVHSFIVNIFQLLAAAQKSRLPTPDAPPPSGAGPAADSAPVATDTAMQPPRAAPEPVVMRNTDAVDAQTVSLKSDADNPSEHGASGLAGALAGLLALKSGEVWHMPASRSLLLQTMQA